MKKRIFAGILLFACLAALFGCGGKSRRTVGTCAGYDILYEELRYMALSVRDNMEETYGAGLWDHSASAEAHRAELEEEVLSRLSEEYIILAAAAQYLPERSINDKTTKAAVDAAVAEAIEALGGKKEYKKFLADVYMTEHLMRFELAKAELETALGDALFAGTELESNTAFSTWLTDGNFVRVRQITLPADADIAAIRQALKNGDTPENAIKNTSGASVTAPFYLVRGLAEDPTQEEDAFALNTVGAVGEAREIGNGYRILVRMEDQTEAFLTNQASAFRKRLREVRTDAKLSEIGSTLRAELNDYGRSIDLLQIK